jgi:hypothetical protein
MRHLIISDSPPAVGGNVYDADQDRMTDDGAPAREPVRPSDGDWRDNLGEYDTFVAEKDEGPSAGERPGGAPPGGPAGVDDGP